MTACGGSPRGRIINYGSVAALVGEPRAARGVGYALSHLPPGTDVPWWRVVNRRGAISTSRLTGLAQRQRAQSWRAKAWYSTRMERHRGNGSDGTRTDDGRAGGADGPGARAGCAFHCCRAPGHRRLRPVRVRFPRRLRRDRRRGGRARRRSAWNGCGSTSATMTPGFALPPCGRSGAWRNHPCTVRSRRCSATRTPRCAPPRPPPSRSPSSAPAQARSPGCSPRASGKRPTRRRSARWPPASAALPWRPPITARRPAAALTNASARLLSLHGDPDLLARLGLARGIEALARGGQAGDTLPMALAAAAASLATLTLPSG